MTDWATFRDRARPAIGRYDRMRAIRRVLEQAPAPMSTGEIAAALHVDVELVRHSLKRMRDADMVTKHVPRQQNRTPRWSWVPGALDSVSFVEGHVRQALERGPVLLRELAADLGVSNQAVHAVLVRLERERMVTRTRCAGERVCAFHLVGSFAPYVTRDRILSPTRTPRRADRVPLAAPIDDDDEDWSPPTHYISASRRYALGLPVATQRGAA
ncbi:ArsR family transcriptional regulator [Gemmatimonas sp.]|uniref:ArsR family transcriptional regulator n=1 Tax=Gemmatimonas sp. TaxID=1962908 RepID=UPI00333FF6E6